MSICQAEVREKSSSHPDIEGSLKEAGPEAFACHFFPYRLRFLQPLAIS